MPATLEQSIELPSGQPYDLISTLSPISMALRDPCLRMDGPQSLRTALVGPDGPLVVRLQQRDGHVHAAIAGNAADWLTPRLRSFLGLDFQPPKFDGPPRLKNLARKHAGLRLPRVPLIFPRVIQTVLQQLVSFKDACHGWKQLVRRYGTPAPGHDDLFLPPTAEVLARLASFQFIECGILPEHGRRINALARVARRIESTWDAGIAADAADRTCEFLIHQRGVGPWTIGSLRGSFMGDADAVVLGDYGFPKHVTYFFTGEEKVEGEKATDDDMLELLEPFRPHRYYVLALLLHTPGPPRRGPRRRPLRERMRPRGT